MLEGWWVGGVDFVGWCGLGCVVVGCGGDFLVVFVF